MKNKSIYKQLFSGLKLLILSLTGFLFIISNIIFIFYYTGEQISSSDMALVHISNRLNQYFTSTEHYSRLLLNSNIIQRGYSVYYNDPKNFSAKKPEMSLEINRLTYPAPYIYAISIYDKDYNILISSERKPSPSILADFDFSGARWIKSKKIDIGSDNLIDVFSYIQPFYDYRSGDLYGYMEIAISEKSIAEIYGNPNNKDSFYLLLDKNYNILSKSDYLDTKNELVNRLLSRIHINTRKHLFTKSTFINTLDFSKYSWKLVHIIPLYALIKPALSIAAVFLIASILALILALLISRNFAKNLTKPIYALIEHTRFVRLGFWNEMDYTSHLPEINLLISDFNDMIRSQNKLKNSLLNLEKAKNKIEIVKINEQIKPHFLYNTLDNIYSLASLDEKETLMKLVMDLSKFYRGSLSLGKSFVRIKDELNTSIAYLDIMCIRYHYKFDYEIICDKNLYDFTCPKLILLPLIENSIYHGIKGLKYRGYIRISIKENGDEIHFNITDNGFGLNLENIDSILNDKSETNSHFALKHINQLLNIYYGQKYRLDFKNNEIGCTISFKIKKEVSHED